MIKGDPEFEQDIYNLIAGFFMGRISGQVYMSETRPTNSASEDAAIHSPSIGAGQFQSGSVTILVFVQDIDNGTGRLLPNKARIQEISQWSGPLLKHMQAQTTEYAFDLAAYPVGQGSYPNSKEHFVALKYEIKRESI